MPNFVKTPKDEARWKKAKDAVSASKGKSESDFQDSDWALANYIYHKMGKSEEDTELAKGFKIKLKSITGIKNPLKTGTSLVVKTPKAKKMPEATDKPSKFFKNEDIGDVKRVSIQKLRDFLDKAKSKRNLS